MSRVLIADIAVITSMGSDLDALWKGLLNKQSAIKRIHRFRTDNYISSYAALIETLSPDDNRSMIFNLADMLISQLSYIPKETRLFTASTKSGIDTLEKMNKGISVDPQELVVANLPKYLSRKLELNDEGVNISSACASSTIAVAKGASLIASGRADSVLICCMDIISEFVFSGFSALRAMSPEPAQPFDANRKGLTLGEGAAAILLCSEEKMRRDEKREMASLCGWGIANDATHITAPARDGCGLKLAISNALATAGITPREINAVSAHGTATLYNDSMELKVIRSIFNNRDLPVNSIKGSIGHTLGAAGGIELALGVKMLNEGIVPATVGLHTPEKNGEGVVSSDHQYFSGEYLLSTNSGFGGTNAALIIKRRYK